jgi:hypothetical protein
MHVLIMTPGKVLANPDAIIGTIHLREATPTENPRSSKTTMVEHKASNLVSLKKIKS